jgi:hypothetical protein
LSNDFMFSAQQCLMKEKHTEADEDAGEMGISTCFEGEGFDSLPLLAGDVEVRDADGVDDAAAAAVENSTAGFSFSPSDNRDDDAEAAAGAAALLAV